MEAAEIERSGEQAAALADGTTVKPSRSTAVAVGLLFLVATGFYMLGQTVYAPILESTAYLDLAYPARARIGAGILLEVVGVLAIPLIALVLYPVLRKWAEAAALAYVGLRVLEAVALLVVDVCNWATVSVSRGYLEAGPAQSPAWSVAGATLQVTAQSAFLLSVTVIFPLGVLILNSVLWKTRLVPRLISGWGFAAGVILLCGAGLAFFDLLTDVPRTGLEVVLTGPIAIQEIVLAVWLIAKGFSDGAAPTGSA